MISRRSVIIGGTGLAGLSAFGGMSLGRQAAAATPVRITQAVTALAFVQNYVAQSQGYFADAGLDAALIDTRGGGPDVQAVLAGAAEFTANDGAQVLPALQKGAKLICVLNLLNRSIINVTMSTGTAARLGVTEAMPFAEKVTALKGARIGVTRPGSLTWQTARANLINAGMDPDSDARIIGVGGAAALAAALENDSIDAMYISVPIGDRVVARGNGITLIDNAKGEDPNIPVFMMEGLWVTPEFLAEQPETVEKTVGALQRASRFILDNDAETVADAVSQVFGGLGRDVLVQGCARVARAVSRTGRITDAELRFTENVLNTNGFLERSFAVDEIFDGRFV